MEYRELRLRDKHSTPSRQPDPLSCSSRMDVATESVLERIWDSCFFISLVQEFYRGWHGRISISPVSAACILAHNVRYFNDIRS